MQEATKPTSKADSMGVGRGGSSEPSLQR